jgi:hypothetical protein
LSQVPCLFCFQLFGDRVSLFAQVDLDYDPPIYASYKAEMTSTYHHIQLLAEMGVSLTFAQTGLKL